MEPHSVLTDTYQQGRFQMYTPERVLPPMWNIVTLRTLISAVHFLQLMIIVLPHENDRIVDKGGDNCNKKHL